MNSECVVTPTIFPDGTSQVWKLPENVLLQTPVQYQDYQVVWYFENEAEIIHVLQLADLVYSIIRCSPTLIIPFLPYGRQDKKTSNQTTFALNTFTYALSHKFAGIITFDAHGGRSETIKSIDIDDQIAASILHGNPDLVCFPDKGATKRGYELNGVPSFNLEKTRNQSTGDIEGLVCSLPLNLTDKRILIVDDLCDGGKTFIVAAKLLYNMGAISVDLYVTHGIFSKGLHVLTESGKISNIYTTDSIIKNNKLKENHPNLTVFKLDV
jgi:ribose-phosphate pyrophosphokinase